MVFVTANSDRLWAHLLLQSVSGSCIDFVPKDSKGKVIGRACYLGYCHQPIVERALCLETNGCAEEILLFFVTYAKLAHILQPLPLGAVAMIGLGVAMVTKLLPFAGAFSAFASEIPWLIALAFFLARGFIKTGLGNRIAYYIVSLFGKSTLGLTYSLVFSEALLAPAIPSLAARAGGIFLPLTRALCVACGSDPANGTERKMGAYVMLTVFQTSTVTSGMFITAMAANPLSVNLATAAIGQTISWGQWALAASIPGLICLISVPLILYVVYPPEVKDSPEAPDLAKEELKKLGPMSNDEKIMAGALLTTVGIWIFGSSIGIGAVAASLCLWSWSGLSCRGASTPRTSRQAWASITF